MLKREPRIVSRQRLAMKDNYKGLTTPLAELRDGSGIVVKELVDSKNRTIYVIKRGDDISMDYAENVRVNYVQNNETTKKTLVRHKIHS